MGAIVAIATVVILMMIGVPVVFAFAAMTLALSMMYDLNVSALMVTGFWSINSIILVALPLFIMTGYLMQSGGIAKRLVAFTEALVGKSKSGMGTSMIVSSGIFGAISGTATAAVASIGSTPWSGTAIPGPTLPTCWGSRRFSASSSRRASP